MTGKIQVYEGLGGYAGQIGAVAAGLLDEFVEVLPPHSKAAAWALERVKEYSLRPSKRIRGSLAAAAYDHATGQTYSQAGLQLAAAIEIAQNYLLIVDDVIDRSDTRRGLPTVHRLYGKFAPEADEHEADMIGILVGELAGQIMNRIVSAIDEAPEHRLRVIQALTHDLTITDLAQIDDIRHQFGAVGISEADLLRKYQQKSSYYSFVNPLVCGLVLAGRDEQSVRRDAEAFGLPAGVAFQLRDDYLGVFGEADSTGKPNLDDLREGKYTLMVHVAAERASAADKDLLGELLGNESVGEVELEQFRAILQSTGAADEAMARANEYVDTAVKAAHGSTSWSPEFGDMLAGLVKFAVNRAR